MTVSSKKVRALLKIGLTLTMLVVVMLATVGAWEIYKGTVTLVGSAHADGVFDLLKCYTIKAVPGLGKAQQSTIVLLDELHPKGQHVFVLSPHSVCTSARKLAQ
jgi:hypothetical protein